MKKKWRFILVGLVLVLAAQTPVMADVDDSLSPVIDQPSAWDVADLAADVATQRNTRCPEGMYINSSYGACKYAQGDYVSSCSGFTASGRCFARTISKLRVRGGTADSRSPARTGSCPYAPPGVHSSFKSWQTTEMTIWENQNGNSVLRYRHVGLVRDNCDVQAGPFSVSPNITVRYPTYIFYTFKHYCRSGEACGDQTSWVDFYVSVD